MKMLRTFVLVPALTVSLFSTVPTKTVDHSLWDQVLKTHVSENGEVDYARIRAHREVFDEYIRLLGESSPDNRPEMFPTQAHELAYWLNAYNAFTIRGIVDRCPIEMVERVGLFKGSFRNEDHVAGGRAISLITSSMASSASDTTTPAFISGLCAGRPTVPRYRVKPFGPKRLTATWIGLLVSLSTIAAA